MTLELITKSNTLYQELIDDKNQLVSTLEKEKQSPYLIEYARLINMKQSYSKILDEFNKILNFAESRYTQVCNELITNAHPAFKGVKSLLNKTLTVNEINNQLDDLIKKNTVILPNELTQEIEYEDNTCECGHNECNDEGTCINCGLTSDELIYTEQERRAYTREEKEDRLRNEPKWRSFGSRTLVGMKGERTDANNHLISPKMTSLINRLSKIQVSLVNSLERNLWESNPLFNKVKGLYPDYIIEVAQKKIYESCVKKKLTMGRSIRQFVITSIYASIKTSANYDKNLDDYIDEIHGVILDDKDYINATRSIMKALKVMNKNNVLEELGLKFKNHMNYSNVQNGLGLNGNDMMKIKKAYESIPVMMKTGKDPKGFIAGITYIYLKDTGNKKTQAEVAKVCKVTEVTLRTRTKQLRKKIHFKN